MIGESNAAQGQDEVPESVRSGAEALAEREARLHFGRLGEPPAASTYVWMVCNNCGHIDSGPDGAFYECPACGSGDGWGAEDHADAVRRAAAILERGRVDDPVLGYCPHGVNLDRDFCPKGCRV